MLNNKFIFVRLPTFGNVCLMPLSNENAHHFNRRRKTKLSFELLCQICYFLFTLGLTKIKMYEYALCKHSFHCDYCSIDCLT